MRYVPLILPENMEFVSIPFFDRPVTFLFTARPITVFRFRGSPGIGSNVPQLSEGGNWREQNDRSGGEMVDQFFIRKSITRAIKAPAPQLVGED